MHIYHTERPNGGAREGVAEEKVSEKGVDFLRPFQSGAFIFSV